MQIHKMQNFVQVMFRPIIRTDKTYVGSSNGAGLGNFGVGVAVEALKGVGVTLEVMVRPSLPLPLGRGSACRVCREPQVGREPRVWFPFRN